MTSRGDAPNILIALENVRSAQNVGSIFRTADGAGATAVVLIGYTPAPIDRFGRARKDIAKTALGAETTVPWMAYEHAIDFLTAMRKEKRQIIVLEQHERAIDYREAPRATRAVLVVGNEKDGVSPEILAAADRIISIPMRGEKESLNVSVASGIALYALLQHH